MMHAKTTVSDGAWCRVGSSNMNSASLMGNWELDVGVLDRGLAAQLEGLFLADLASSREIVLPRTDVAGARAHPAGEGGAPRQVPLDPQGTLAQRWGSIRATRTTGRLGAPLVRAGSALGGALAGNRTLGREDRTVLGTVAIVILLFSALAAFAPTLVGWMVAAVGIWFGTVTGIRAFAQRRRGRAEESHSGEDLGGNQESETSP